MKTLAIILCCLLLLCYSCSTTDKDHTKRNKYLHIAMTDDPSTLDPRLVRDLTSSSVMRMLFEGLMTIDAEGKITPGIAENYTLSEDKKTYTFYLRPSTWSDGSLLTANDFEETLKSSLAKNFPAPNAYQLCLIKGAKEAKEGLLPLNLVGIKALNSSTLTIELHQPAPFFLELLTCHFFFPVHQSMRNATQSNQSSIISNGPFILKKWDKRKEIIFTKNLNYWNSFVVVLEGVAIQILDEMTALHLFKAGQLDWVGSPLSTLPQDAITVLKEQNQLKIAPGAGTHWIRLNTEYPPFNDEKMRKAFALALNRQALIEHITQSNQLVALGIVPPSFGIDNPNEYEDDQLKQAQILFKEALEEAQLNKMLFTQLCLSYASNDRNHKIAQAIQQQWNQAFSIEISLNCNESHTQLEKVKMGNYALSLGSWYADIQDPINFLEIFKFKDNPTNQTFWSNPHYTLLLENSSQETNQNHRLTLLSQAQKLLIKEMPVIPLFHSSYNFLKSDLVEGVYFSPLGFLDFKHASFNQNVQTLE